MNKLNISLIALLLAVAAVLGTYAATRTASLGTASRLASNAAYSAQVKRLDAFSARLQHQLAAKPAHLQQHAGMAAAPAAPTARVIYRRPPAIVIVKHRPHGGDDRYESAAGGGHDD